MYGKYKTIINFAAVGIKVWQSFFVLLWCTFWKGYDTWTKGEKLYCYDNSYADMKLNGGYKPSGIYGYVDIFTWEGWIQVYIFSWIAKIIKREINNLLWQALFIFLYLFNPEIPMCLPGENLNIAFGLLNGCTFVENVLGSNLR